ncbi:MAG TPA: glycogen phosphorylase, partial [Eubacteriaceae bacterium]|nr:glycogen phosphorylase [Eubacteriaceae bacterium]
MEYQMDLEKSFMRAMHQVAAKDLSESQLSEQYEALGALIREQIGPIWQETKEKQEKEKSVYYFSMEFLTGKFTQKNLEYLDLYEKLCDFFAEKGLSLQKVLSIESEPGLGNGGLGRLAAAFLDSLSSLSYSGHGYGIRYEKGLFKQRLDHGYQTEEPDNWLDQKNIWEYPRFDEKLKVRFGGRIRVTKEGEELKFHHVDYEEVYAIPYDIPVIGYKNGNINTLRLWSAKSVHDLNFHEFSSGNLSAAFHEENKAKSICQILYPNDSYYEGKKLRLKQEYFLVSAGMQDLIRKVEKRKIPLKELPRYIAIHINDTHPAMAIPELMRILLDEYELEWVEAWDITVKTCAFTNHTLLEEAMEKWDINLFREVVPRIWQITEEINNRFLDALRNKYQVTAAEEIEKLSIIQYGTVRMVNLSIVGTHSINGVAKLHSDILRTKELKHFARLYPDRFNNKTNGIVHRHWLLTANKQLTAYIEELIGDGFKTDPKQLKELLKFE